ncbi:HD superfamily phosphohydrolase [Mesoplasma entomophilum]|uniref:HD family phosphohydrolase n=1 Tax=Mesoplasma entomophilum TaxID=2149 RepID=A0A3S5Y006_9MOLU|nr:HD domain-containing protein [Mesoplasma entomophilum]ATQ35823.1 HD family phosphohydrolase [Mesoplasma entomophilum]ATZ19793.1 HD superfamily phosphohydrolase [Mesoplasma entomophilum]
MEKVFRDSVHGDIFIHDEIFMEIINTPEMQRLRRILQLGGAQFAYAGASHTRFTHCIGVYHIISQFLQSPDFIKISEKDKKNVLLAGLMHDIGHGPFSHTFEKISKRSHEEYSADIIRNPKGNISKILKKHKVDPEDIVAILEGKHSNKILNSLVSSQLDADRIDYLMRDSYHCGVNYASLDTEFLIRSVRIVDDKIVFPKKTIHAIESYLLGRYHMYKQVYEHKISTGFDVTLISWFERIVDLNKKGYDFKDQRINNYFSYIFNGQNIPIDLYLILDDFTMFDIMKSCQKENDHILSDLSDRLINRNFLKLKEADEFKIREIKTLLKEQGKETKYYFIEPKFKKPSIYRDGEIDGKDQTIHIVDKNNTVKSLTKFSLLANTVKYIEDEKTIKKYFFPKEVM